MIAQDQERFEAKILKTASCWLWTASYDKDGYGYFQLDGIYQRAHRVSYELYKGPIPEGMLVCHTCHIPSCVNPDHLYAGTELDNNQARDAIGHNANSRKTHCKRGHEYNEKNTHITAKGERQCRVCAKEAAKAKRDRIAKAIYNEQGTE